MSGLLHLSRHRVHWDRRQWMTGLHLLEAMKLLPDRPDLAERIRQCGMVEEAMVLAEVYREYWRRDWEQVGLDRVRRVLCLLLRRVCCLGDMGLTALETRPRRCCTPS